MLKIYNMIKIVVLFLLFSITVNAQEDVYEKIGKETCTCLESKKLDLNDTSQGEKLTMMVGLCMIESYTAHKMELPEIDRSGFNDNDGMKRLGEKVALKMINYCPDYVIALGSLPDEDAENGTPIKEMKVEGKIIDIETKQFVTFKVKDKNGRTHNLLLLDYFETASLFTEGKIKSGTELIAGYTEVELYDPVSKDFKYFKILTSFEKK